MKVVNTKIKDLRLIKVNKIKDHRGIFYRNYCNKVLNLITKKKIVQSNISINKKKFTLRGFHYQNFPFSENKIITCINGSILLVLVNIDKKSPNYLKNIKIKLSSKMNKSVLISKTCATAFLTLEPKTLVLYYMSNYYKKNKSMGIRYNDPKLKIKWPKKVKIISNRDLKFKNIS